MHTREISAENYAEACYRLGMIHGLRFLREEVPADFELQLNDGIEITITRDRL